jgi:NAD(P)-dependent dehydrogenase (short-subunit alcohol dehydrogenase family)
MQHKRIALITGANQGVGFQVAKELAADGVTVLVGARDMVKGEAAAQEIGEGATAVQLDVTEAASIAAAAERIRSEYGRLDLLVNNAAVSRATRNDIALEDYASHYSAANVSPMKSGLSGRLTSSARSPSTRRCFRCSAFRWTRGSSMSAAVPAR